MFGKLRSCCSQNWVKGLVKVVDLIEMGSMMEAGICSSLLLEPPATVNLRDGISCRFRPAVG